MGNGDFAGRWGGCVRGSDIVRLSGKQTQVSEFHTGVRVYISYAQGMASWSCPGPCTPPTPWPCPWSPNSMWEGAGPQVLTAVTKTSELVHGRCNQPDEKRHIS